MATNPTKAELAGELTARLVDVESGLREYRALTDHRLNSLENTCAELERVVAEVRKQNAVLEERLKAFEKHADHPATLSAFDQRLKALEKGADRTWQFAAMGISVVAILVSLIVAFLKK